MVSKVVVRLLLTFVLCVSLFIIGCGGPSKPKPALDDQSDQTVSQQAQTEQPTDVKQAAQESASEQEQAEPEEKDATQTATQEPTQEQPDEPQPPVRLALKFKPEDSSTYKLSTQSEKSVLWEGPEGTKPSNFGGGHTGSDVDLVFDQLIESVNEQGNAIIKISIKSLKYKARVKDNVVLDFDSETNTDSPLYPMIGKSYTIEFTPSGHVVRVVNSAEIRGAIKGNTPAANAAQKLVSDDVIKERHTIPALPTGAEKEFSKGQSWSANKSFDFGMMGPKSYERIYKLKDVEESNGDQIAVAEMNAVPSTQDAKELHQEQSSGGLSKMFDNKESYTGKLELDLTTGQIREFTEKFKTEWLAVDPSYNPEVQKRPNALRMAAHRLFHLERID